MPRSVLVLAALLALPACRDVGLAGNIPLAEAEHKTLLPLVAQVHPPQEVDDAGLAFAGTRWADVGLPVEIPARDLREVGSGHGQPVYALRWDAPPFARIYARVASGWQPYEPIRGVNRDGDGQEPIVH